jgi:peptide/nickel transport system substrate-binding protein
MFWKRVPVAILSLLLVLAVLASCGPTPEPQVVEKVVTQEVEKVVTQVVQETVIVEGTPEVVEVEKEVTTVVEQVVTATPAAEELPDLVVGDVFFFSRGFGPPDVGSFFDHRVAYQMYDGLASWDVVAVSHGEPANPVPGLAESWEISEDGLEYTFTLRSGINFTTGRPVNAEAVKASLDRALAVIEAQDLSGRYAWVEYYDSVEVIDDMTVRITLNTPYAPLLATLASNEFKIVDAEEAMAHEEDGDLGHKWMIENSAGSGPFMMEEFVPEQRVTLRRNPDYWGGADGVYPSVERLIFAHVPENSTRELQVGRGELDVALQLPPVSVRSLQDDPNVNVELLPTLMACNFLVDLRAGPLPEAHPALLQALRHGLNYEGLLDVVAGGIGEIHQSLILPNMLGHEDEIAHMYEYDPEGAKQLMADAGYPDGFDIVIQSRAGACGPVVYGKGVEFWQQNLAEIGVRAEIVESTGANFWGQIQSEELRDFGISGLGATYMDPDSMTAIHILNEGNLLGWDDVDPEGYGRAEELSNMAKAETDLETRQEMYAEISRLSAERSPIITFLYPQDPVVMRETVTGAFPAPGSFPMDFKYIVKE